VHTVWDGVWQIRDADVEEKGCHDGFLWDAVLEALCVVYNYG